jgi:hypothetical protein
MMKTTSMVAMALALAGTADAACDGRNQKIAVASGNWKKINSNDASTVGVSTAGYVCRTSVADQIEMKFTLTDTETDAAKLCGDPTTGTANSCGIHLHFGTCADVKGHAYDTSITTDPWDATIVYKTTVDVTKTIVQKQTMADVANQVLVAHDKTGAKIACAPLAYAGGTQYKIESKFAKQKDYAGSIETSHDGLTFGFYAPSATSTKAIITGKIKGDTACNAAFSDDTGNKCGLHLHKTSCAEKGGDHAFTGTVTSDPWGAGLKQMYVHDQIVSNVYDAGYTMAETMPLSVIVHDSTGARIACLPVKNPAKPDSAASVGVGATSVLVLAAMALM